MKNIIKRIFVGVAIALIVGILSGCNVVHAKYVYLETNNGNAGLPTDVPQIVLPTNNWPNSGYLFMRGSNDWLLSLGQYWYNSSMNGNEMIVEADYYFGIETVSGSLPYYYYITNGDARNTLKSENLRCGIGSAFRSGYDNTYSPQVTNFSVTVLSDLSQNAYPHTTYHIKFKYQQKLGSNKSGGSNMSCWFERIPSTGLFTQVYGSSVNNLYFGYTSNLSYAVSNDPNTQALQTITSQNSTMINQNQQQINNQNTMINQNNTIIDQNRQINTNIVNGNQQTQNKIQEQTDFLKDSSIPPTSDYNFDSYNEDNGVITNLLTMPITLIQGMLNGLNNGCSSYLLGSIKGQSISLPCIYPGNHLGIAWNIIDIIMSGVFIYIFGKKCITIFNDVTNLKSNQVDEVFK